MPCKIDILLEEQLVMYVLIIADLVTVTQLLEFVLPVLTVILSVLSSIKLLTNQSTKKEDTVLMTPKLEP